MLAAALDQGYTGFEGVPLSGTDMAGGGIPYHRSMQAFGSTDKNEPEQKLLYYADAFFTKEASIPSSARAESDRVDIGPEVKKELEFKVFPNPAIDEFNLIVEVPIAGLAKIQIIDFSGRIQYDQNLGSVDEGIHWIRMTNISIPAGNYVLKFNSNSFSQTAKLKIE